MGNGRQKVVKDEFSVIIFSKKELKIGIET